MQDLLISYNLVVEFLAQIIGLILFSCIFLFTGVKFTHRTGAPKLHIDQKLSLFSASKVLLNFP